MGIGDGGFMESWLRRSKYRVVWFLWVGEVNWCRDYSFCLFGFEYSRFRRCRVCILRFGMEFVLEVCIGIVSRWFLRLRVFYRKGFGMEGE